MNSKGNAYNNLKEYKKAIDSTDKVLQIHPKHINALYNKGTTYCVCECC